MRYHLLALSLLYSLNCEADKKPRLDSIQKKYAGRIMALQRQHESKLSKLRNAIRQEYLVEIKKLLSKGSFSEAQNLQQKLNEIKNEEKLVKKAKKSQFNLNILLDKKVQRPLSAAIHNGHAYKVFAEKITWTEAKKKCEDMGGYLVCIEDKAEDEFVRRLLKENRRMFIGLYRDGRTWRWLNGSSLKYKNWRPGQGGKKGEESVGILWDNIKFWDDHFPEQVEHGFICEWDF